MHHLFREHICSLFQQVITGIPHAHKMPSYARSGGQCYVVKGKRCRYLFDLGFVPQRDHFFIHLLWTPSSGRPRDEGELMLATMQKRRGLNEDIPAVMRTLQEGLLQPGDIWAGGNDPLTLAVPFVPEEYVRRLAQDDHARNMLSVFGFTEINLTQVEWETAELCGLHIGSAEIEIACGPRMRDHIAHVVIDGFLPFVSSDACSQRII